MWIQLLYAQQKTLERGGIGDWDIFIRVITMPRIVGIDSFDTPNAANVKPKKYVGTRARPQAYPNPGPMKPRNVDRRNGVTRPRLNGGVQEVQLLLLTSGVNPLLQADTFPQVSAYACVLKMLLNARVFEGVFARLTSSLRTLSRATTTRP